MISKEAIKAGEEFINDMCKELDEHSIGYVTSEMIRKMWEGKYDREERQTLYFSPTMMKLAKKAFREEGYTVVEEKNSMKAYERDADGKGI